MAELMMSDEIWKNKFDEANPQKKLNPTPYNLYPTPYTLNPTPYTLNPEP